MKSRIPLIENIVLVCFAILFLCICINRHKAALPNVISSDTKGYYMYLPAVFVYKNIHSLPDQHFQGRNKNEKGESYTKYSCGTAYFYLPFFLAAHVYAQAAHIDASGFSAPYCYAIMICGVFWAFVGLFLLKKLLLRYFGPVATWITLLVIMLGTNFFNYASFENGMSHVYGFTLFAAAALVMDSYYRKPTKGLAMLAGALVAWIILARPTNIFAILFLVLFNVVTKKDFKERFVFFKNHFSDLLLAIPCFIAVLIPQLLYWKAMTGQWVKYSYVGEGFDNWAHPKIADVLFDTQNGLFLYSPALLFMFWSLFARRKDPRTNFWGTISVFAIITYLFASWWVPCFCAAFGHRCYVEYYALFAFPLAVTMERILAIKKLSLKAPVFLILIVFCYYNVAASEIYLDGGRLFDGPEWHWNWDTWLDLVRQIF